MMADNKEQRVCVKFCFLLGTVSEPDCRTIVRQSGSEQSSSRATFKFLLFLGPPSYVCVCACVRVRKYVYMYACIYICIYKGYAHSHSVCEIAC
jgi:hypothetical protein